MFLTDQEYRQVQAALMLWVEVASRSRVHPSQHPAVSEILPAGDTGMAPEDILLLIERPNESVPEQGMTVHDAARLFGVKPNRLATALRRVDAQAVTQVGPFKLYAPADLEAAGRKLQKRDEKFQRRYARWGHGEGKIGP